MTAKDIFDSALALVFGDTRDRTEYAPFVISTLNVLLAENFALNNALRETRNKEKLESVPIIADINDTVPYEEELNRVVLPYGCAGYIVAEDDRAMSDILKNKYEYERGELFLGKYEEVGDVYL